jgi:tRNA A64-2'-O-ribosylphosphate transferase
MTGPFLIFWRAFQAFPDSLTFTLPIWCAVVNGAVSVLRGQGQAVAPGECSLCECSLPPWVTASERSRVGALIPPWADWLAGALRGTATGEELVRRLHRQLRPVWVKPGDRLWGGMLPGTGADFVPIVAVSASRPTDPAEHREHHR